MMGRWQRQGGPWDDRAFTWVVFLCPLFLLLDWWVLRSIGGVPLASVLVRGWGTARRDPGMLSFLCFVGLVVAIDEQGGVTYVRSPSHIPDGQRRGHTSHASSLWSSPSGRAVDHSVELWRPC